MAPNQHDPSQNTSSGIFSNVFSFVSRELESFVATAAGGEPPAKTAPRASSSRVKLDSKVKNGGEQGKRKRTVSTREAEQELQGARQRTRRDQVNKPMTVEESADGPLPEKTRKTQTTIPVSKPAARPQPRLPPSDDETKAAKAAVGSDRQEAPPRAASSASNVHELKRKRSVTMPGSLFPRSPSIEPEPTPAPPMKTDERHVHFTPRSNDAQPLYPVVTPMESIAERSYSQDLEDEDNPFLSERRTPAQLDRITSNSDDAKRFLDDFNLSPRSSPTPESPAPARTAPPRRLLLESPIDLPPSPLPLSAKAKGKQKAVEVDDSLSGDTSQVLRFRGKERELQEAKEEQWRKEQDRGDDPETSIMLQEREQDKERIKQLEAEVIALRKQLAESRRAGSVSDVPPPPPPAPPPPPPSARRSAPIPVTVAGIRSQNAAMPTASTDSFLAAARAALRKQAPPMEAPINPLHAPRPAVLSSKAQRTGRPSVNVPSEKMEAFLTEVRSAKLKKVSGTLAPPLSSDSARTSLARSLSGTEKGKELLRTIERRRSLIDMEPQLGQKRKRAQEDTGMNAESETALKRVATEGSLTISDTSSSSAPSGSNIFDFSQSNRSWPSVSTTDTDVTTPSLCSDNENDEVSPEDILPPTPPRRPPTPPRRLKRPSRAVVDTPDADKSLPEIIDIIHDHPEHDTPIAHVPPPANPTRQRGKSTSPEDAFAKRPPSSPMPAVVTKKPKPPGRARAQLRIQPVPFPESDTSFGPISLSTSQTIVIPTDISRPAPAKKPQKPATRTSRAEQPTRAPTARSGTATSGRSQAAQRAQRRGTLDEELRRADDLFRDDHEGDGVEDGTFVGAGTNDMQGGFLARGGGGGSPVYMGVGYVQNAEDWANSRHRTARNQRGTALQPSLL